MASAPTTELGRIAEGGLWPWRTFYVDQAEYVPELQWPLSTRVYDRMGADAKLAGLMRSIELPLAARKWAIDPNGADTASVEQLQNDLDLPIVGEGDERIRRRTRGRFSFKQHLGVALKALQYGYYYFEQVGTVEAVDTGSATAPRWVLKKLAPRPPRTIAEINIEEDGGLRSIKQNLSSGIAVSAPEIGIERMVCYVWGYEAGNWSGVSFLRPCYRNWLIKDRLLRVDAIKHERSGMGVPIAKGAPGMGRDDLIQLTQMMREMKITEDGGGAVPNGVEVALMGTSGSLPDTVESIRFHNEEMNGAFLANFQNLGAGQAGGSYALGKVQYDFFGLALDAIEEWVIETFNAHVIEDWYDWNYGEQSQAARLVCEDEPDPIEQAELLQQGVDESDEAAEEELETFEAEAKEKLRRDSVRARRRRRERAERGRSDAAAGVESPSPPLPDRPLRRAPYEHEVAAATDFKKIDAALNKGVETLVKDLKGGQASQIKEIKAAIVEAEGNLAALAQLKPTPNGKDAILAAMSDAAQMGADEAAAEAKRQGLSSPKKAEKDGLLKRAGLRAAAVDDLLASGFGQAASRQALRLSEGGLTPTQVADRVGAHLGGLSGSYLEQQANGALTAAMNDGRRTTMARNNPSRVYASELLDDATCEECVAIDGEEYIKMEDAEEDYPTGGYVDCLGMERCRGTLVAVYDESPGTPQ